MWCVCDGVRVWCVVSGVHGGGVACVLVFCMFVLVCGALCERRGELGARV